MHGKLTVPSRIKDYDVFFTDDINDVHSLMESPNTMTFVDSNVARLYSSLASRKFVSVDCTEKAKTIEGTVEICSRLIDERVNAKTKLVAVGGGILQDLIGFCASIYCRGLDWEYVPTTLLAQADSCVGGKTSINFKGKKNILGTFCPPSRILIHTGFTQTLSVRDYISGLGEIYKFHLLRNRIRDFPCSEMDTKQLEQVIVEGLSYKVSILERDEFDKGDRKFLNFGHTFGHAIEAVSDYEVPHGIGVILGCMIAIQVSEALGKRVTDIDNAMSTGARLINQSGLKLKREWFDLDLLLPAIRSDKKSTGNMTMVLIDGNPILTDIQDPDMIRPILRQVYESI
jgi:3-dehydroquinate synthase